MVAAAQDLAEDDLSSFLDTLKRTVRLLLQSGLCVVCLRIDCDRTEQWETGQPKAGEKDAAQQGQCDSGREEGGVQREGGASGGEDRCQSGAPQRARKRQPGQGSGEGGAAAQQSAEGQKAELPQD